MRRRNLPLRWAIATLAGSFGFTLLMAMAVLPAFACSCAVNLTPADAAARADVVFTGVVTSLKVSHPNAPITSSMDPVDVGFQVEGVFKGSVVANQQVRTAASDASCGFPFEAGQRYTVFGQRQGTTVTVDLCHGTTAGLEPPGSPAETRLRASGAAPIEVTEVDPALLPSAWPWIIAVGGTVLVALAIVMARARLARR
jgi:hypothetical protein